jgi:hypothetical protein
VNNFIRSRRKQEKLKPIARKRHNLAYLLLSILLILFAGYLLTNFSPNDKLGIIPIFPIFFLTFGLLIYSMTTFVFREKHHGAILAILMSFYLFLRLLGLTHWIFAVMFIALFIFIELFLSKKK